MPILKSHAPHPLFTRAKCMAAETVYGRDTSMHAPAPLSARASNAISVHCSSRQRLLQTGMRSLAGCCGHMLPCGSCGMPRRSAAQTSAPAARAAIASACICRNRAREPCSQGVGPQLFRPVSSATAFALARAVAVSVCAQATFKFWAKVAAPFVQTGFQPDGRPHGGTVLRGGFAEKYSVRLLTSLSHGEALTSMLLECSR